MLSSLLLLLLLLFLPSPFPWRGHAIMAVLIVCLFFFSPLFLLGFILFVIFRHVCELLICCKGKKGKKKKINIFFKFFPVVFVLLLLLFFFFSLCVCSLFLLFVVVFFFSPPLPVIYEAFMCIFLPGLFLTSFFFLFRTDDKKGAFKVKSTADSSKTQGLPCYPQKKETAKWACL